jgi:hypothetical protein
MNTPTPILLLVATLLAVPAFAKTATGAMPDAADRAAPASWAVGGGELRFEPYPHLLTGMDLSLRGAEDLYRFDPGATLRFEAPDGLFARFIGGALVADVDLALERQGKQIEIRQLRLVPEDGEGLLLRLVDDAGREIFVIGNAHYLLSADSTVFSIRSANLLLGSDAARLLGLPEVAREFIGRVRLNTPVQSTGAGLDARNERNFCSGVALNWHGTLLPPPNPQGLTYQTDVLLENASAMFNLRCVACDGPGPLDGTGKFAPDAYLRNSDTNTTADVPWYTKFIGQLGASPPDPNQPPYGNDQHPYLVFNLYRQDADGRFEQIGESGLKHAFLSINTGCTFTCPSNNILFRRCADVYTKESNDTPNDLGPKSELIPHRGIWGRCGSIYDPNCDGVEDPPGYDDMTHRMLVGEHAIDPTRNPGARYFFSAFYLVRDDIDIDNTMGWREIQPTWIAAAQRWQMNQIGEFSNGSALDAWVPVDTLAADRAHRRLRTAEGEVRVAVRVHPLGAGRFRYDYAVQNLTYARAVTQGSEPNLRVLRNLGFSAFSVPNGGSQPEFADTDRDAGNRWPASPDAEGLRWSAPAGNTLDWGRIYRFSFESSQPPEPGEVTLEVAEPGSPSNYRVAVLVPAVDTVLADGFELR